MREREWDIGDRVTIIGSNAGPGTLVGIAHIFSYDPTQNHLLVELDNGFYHDGSFYRIIVVHPDNLVHYYG